HLRHDLLGERQEGQVHEQRLILRMVHDPGNLLGKKTRVERVVDAAHAHDAIPGLKMPAGVPGKRRYAIAGLVAVPHKLLRHLEGAAARYNLAPANSRPLDGWRDDSPVWMLPCCVVHALVANQRPVRHQSEHTVPPNWISSCRRIGRKAPKVQRSLST